MTGGRLRVLKYSRDGKHQARLSNLETGARISEASARPSRIRKAHGMSHIIARASRASRAARLKIG
jgi:hypothetical protein